MLMKLARIYDNYIATPAKKQNNKMYMSGTKLLAVKIHDQTVGIKEIKNLYGHLVVLIGSNRAIDQKYAVGNYEFTLTSRAFFAPDGSMLACIDKSKLIYNYLAQIIPMRVCLSVSKMIVYPHL